MRHSKKEENKFKVTEVMSAWISRPSSCPPGNDFTVIWNLVSLLLFGVMRHYSFLSSTLFMVFSVKYTICEGPKLDACMSRNES